jgi:hypothetical protein
MDTSSLEIFPQIAISIGIVAAIFFIYLVFEQLYRSIETIKEVIETAL